MLLVEGCCETGPFRHLSQHLFRSPYFQKYITFEGHLFFRNVQNLIQICKMHKKIRFFFCFFKSLHLNWLRKIVTINNRILPIGIQ